MRFAFYAIFIIRAVEHAAEVAEFQVRNGRRFAMWAQGIQSRLFVMLTVAGDIVSDSEVADKRQKEQRTKDNKFEQHGRDAGGALGSTKQVFILQVIVCCKDGHKVVQKMHDHRDDQALRTVAEQSQKDAKSDERDKLKGIDMI